MTADMVRERVKKEDYEGVADDDYFNVKGKDEQGVEYVNGGFYSGSD